jgi:hypothetical protein
MLYRKLDLFPTSILTINMEDEITEEDRKEMILDADKIIDRGIIETNPSAPKYQTPPIIFSNSSLEVWKKLERSFLSCCHFYLQTVEGFCHHQNIHRITHTRAWVYKSNNVSVEPDKSVFFSPWHTHSPAFLCGIFYLSVPDNEKNNLSTGFRDPRGLAIGSPLDVNVHANINCWNIFPGWLPHRANVIDSPDWRYTVAADAFITI